MPCRSRPRRRPQPTAEQRRVRTRGRRPRGSFSKSGPTAWGFFSSPGQSDTVRYAFAALRIRENRAANLGTIRIGLSATGLRSANQGLSVRKGRDSLELDASLAPTWAQTGGTLSRNGANCELGRAGTRSL